MNFKCSYFSSGRNPPKALLNRKFMSKEIPALMEKVFQLSVKSPMEGVRSSCRQLALQYLLNYPLGKKIKGEVGRERRDSQT